MYDCTTLILAFISVSFTLYRDQSYNSISFGLIHAKRVPCFFAFSDLPSAILPKLNSATTFLASITLYIYNNIINIFQFKTKVKTRENRSAQSGGAHKLTMSFFLVTLFRVGFFLAVAYLMVSNLARLGISVRC